MPCCSTYQSIWNKTRQHTHKNKIDLADLWEIAKTFDFKLYILVRFTNSEIQFIFDFIKKNRLS